MKHILIKSNAFTLIELLVVIAIINILMAMTFPAVLSVRESVRRGYCQNNLTKIVIATKMYEESFGVLPSGTINTDRPIRNVPIGNHLGWIPRILPFLEQSALYHMIDFSKDVYDPANEQGWFSETPVLFRCPSSHFNAVNRHSNYMACHEGIETPIDVDNRGTFFLNSRLRSKDILDGNSCTVWFGEATIIPIPHWKSELPSGSTCTSLGWMSGTPGTIRNTGQKINAKPFCVTWMMPFTETGQINQNGLPYKISSNENNETDTENNVNNDTKTILPNSATLWSTELPEQFQVGGFNSFHVGGANHAFGDGNVRMIFETINLDLYQKLGCRDDGKTVSLDD
ncbi:MAG: DUF1559 domain-containing protein [Planctomycetaceae bacterium]|jgi:prepilin-type N-terminal cleavage/methylation domain-containing protein|nr:DUF1559 domain-containing protein [Planctomycetaceae bacterium]